MSSWQMTHNRIIVTKVRIIVTQVRIIVTQVRIIVIYLLIDDCITVENDCITCKNLNYGKTVCATGEDADAMHLSMFGMIVSQLRELLTVYHRRRC